MLSTLAIYLPQFHRVPENDRWWGEGFTEWTAVKGAEALYAGHNQPRVPLNKNYYNLLEHETMVWQTELMKKYHIDGMCFYHYWFGNGKKILEKPAENLLEWNDIDMPFCFCWVNRTWSRTWKKLSDTTIWSSIYETGDDPNGNGILMQQTYGREEEWKEHFEYLLPFFKDNRYIKLNGRPIFVIYQPEDIFSLKSMINYFNMRMGENDLPDIYFIGIKRNILSGFNVKDLDAVCIKQPDFTMIEHLHEYKNSMHDWTVYPYDEVWEKILNPQIQTETTYLCAMVDYDNSPRAGKEGVLMEGASPEKFYRYFKSLYKTSLLLNNDFIFVNAWNEWGEGMYLEPDEKNGYGYLEALSRAIVEGNEDSSYEAEHDVEKLYETDLQKKERIEKEYIRILRIHDDLLNNWIYLKEENIDFSIYFKKYNYESIAIYGMGKLGIHLLKELNKWNVNVVYGIDQTSKNGSSILKIFTPDEPLPEVDAVVITVMDQYSEIIELLNRTLKCSMITIEEIIGELITE